MHIELDGLHYFLRGPLQIAKSSRFPPVLRQTGEEQRALRQPFPEWAPGENGLSGGAGRKYWRASNNEFHFATAHTLWENQITLPLRAQTATESGFDGSIQMQAYADLNGTLYGFCMDTSSSLECGTLSGITWSQASVIEAGLTNGVVHDADSYEGSLIVLYETGSTTARMRTSSDGSSWSSVETLTNQPPTFFTFHPDSKEAYYVSFASNLIYVYKSPNALAGPAVWTQVCTIPTTAGATALEMFFYQGQLVPYVGTREALYRIDVEDSEYIEAVTLRGNTNANNCKSMKRWGNFLAIPTVYGGMLLYAPNGQILEFGVDIGDGFPEAYLGDITALYADKWLLLAAVKGNTHTGVYMLDGRGWHTLWTLTNSSVTISAITTANSTIGVSTALFSHAAGSNIYVANFNVNPLEQPTATMTTHGYEESC